MSLARSCDELVIQEPDLMASELKLCADDKASEKEILKRR